MEDSKIAIILDAAKKRFAHYGLSKTAMIDIANDIGMSKASLYYYFKDKEQIFMAVVEEDMNEFVKAIEELIERPNKAAFKLKKYISLKHILLTKFINLAKIDTFDAKEVFNPVYDDLKQRFTKKEKELIEKIFHIGIAEKEFIKFPVEDYADLFVSTASGLRTVALTGSRVESAHEEASRQTALFLEIFLKSIKV